MAKPYICTILLATVFAVPPMISKITSSREQASPGAGKWMTRSIVWGPRKLGVGIKAMYTKTKRVILHSDRFATR